MERGVSSCGRVVRRVAGNGNGNGNGNGTFRRLQEGTIKEEVGRYLPEIASVLNKVPRELLLIFKTNDLLRGIEYSLGTKGR